MAIRQADALDVLALGQLAGLVTRKRSFRQGEPSTADFTIGALAKDMDLLAAASSVPLRAASEVARGFTDLGRSVDLVMSRLRDLSSLDPGTVEWRRAIINPARAVVLALSLGTDVRKA